MLDAPQSARRLTRRKASRPASGFAGCAGRRVQIGAVLCGVLLFAGLVPAVRAQSEAELREAAARLASSTLQPLPDSALNRDVGQIAVIEHDGSNYDERLPDGSLNYEARTRVGRKFYETHRDDYDFLVVLHELRVRHGRRDGVPPVRPQRRRGHRASRSAAPARTSSAAPRGSRAGSTWPRCPATDQPPLSTHAGRPGLPAAPSTSWPTRWATSGSPRPGSRWAGPALERPPGRRGGALELPARLRRVPVLRRGLARRRRRHLHRGARSASGTRPRPLPDGLPPDRTRSRALTLLRNPSVDRHRINREGEVSRRHAPSAMPSTS